MIASSGVHQQCFGLAIPALRRALNEEGADFLGARRTARLAGAVNRNARRRQDIGEEP
jgi:hypothetical protein